MSPKPKIKYATQSSRRRRQWLLRLGVWIFVLVFALSIVGGLFVFIH